MTGLDQPALSTSRDASMAGWLVSLILHGALAFGAFLFLQQIKLAPQQTPFQWDVAMVAPAAEATAPSTHTTTQSTPSTRSTESMSAPAPAKMEHPLQPSKQPSPAEQAQTTDPIPSQPVAEPTQHPPTHAEQILPPPSPPTSVPQHTASAPVTQPSSALRDSEQASSSPPLPASNTLSQRTSSAPTEQGLAAQDKSETIPEDHPLPQQLAALSPAKSIKADHGWLIDLMTKWSKDLDKPYPSMLRTEGIQGKVTVSALLHDDGVLSHIRVAKSSGNTLLDQAAVEAVKNGPPVKLSRPLELPSMRVNIPIVYVLNDAR